MLTHRRADEIIEAIRIAANQFAQDPKEFIRQQIAGPLVAGAAAETLNLMNMFRR